MGDQEKKNEFPGVLVFCHCGISKVHIYHNFVEFPGVELCFVWNSQGWSKKMKNYGWFFKKSRYVLNPLCFFSRIVQSTALIHVCKSISEQKPMQYCCSTILSPFLRLKGNLTYKNQIFFTRIKMISTHQSHPFAIRSTFDLLIISLETNRK